MLLQRMNNVMILHIHKHLTEVDELMKLI